MTPDDALRQLLDATAFVPTNTVTFTGSEQPLPTNLLMTHAGAASQAAVALAADAVWQQRGGQSNQMSLDLLHAGAAVHVHDFLSIEGEESSTKFKGTSAFYQCGDGRWLRTHCNFAHHEEALCAAMDASKDRDAIAIAAQRRPALDWENAVLEAGGCAYMCRSLDEWDAHPQAAALSTLPPLEIIKIGEAPPKPLPAGERPLSGIRVLDLTRVIAGPMMGRTLAEHGATVMRVASPNLPFIASLIKSTGNGKLSAHIDLDTEAGVTAMRHLLTDADVFMQGYKPGGLGRRGFGPDDIARDFPGTVYVSLSAWSHAGPWSHRRGYDSLLQCATGWAAEIGGMDRPALQPAQAIDYVSGYLGALGAMVALHRRATEGGTWLVRLSLAQTRQWIDQLGRHEDPTVFQAPMPGTDAMSDMLMTDDTPFGKMTYLGPVVTMSETPPRWEVPPVPLGTHAPVWPTQNSG